MSQQQQHNIRSLVFVLRQVLSSTQARTQQWYKIEWALDTLIVMGTPNLRILKESLNSHFLSDKCLLLVVQNHVYLAWTTNSIWKYYISWIPLLISKTKCFRFYNGKSIDIVAFFSHFKHDVIPYLKCFNFIIW